MRSEQSWSLLDPRPVLLYLPKHDEYIVYWNGIAMTHSQALCMAMESCAGIYATPEMKSALQKTFERLYYADAFQTRKWDRRLESGSFVYESQRKWMQEHLKKHVADKEPKEILSWFDYSRARKEENV